MRKRHLAVCVLSAVMALGTATLTSYAAEGWVQSGSNWAYTDSNGRQVRNTWKKGADNLWRYLNSQGVMAINTWADDEYYVDNNGIMVTDKWMKIQKKDPGWNEENEMVWYYFTSSGRAMTDGWSKINGQYYYFDEDGEMQTGWVEDDTYYLGEDGAMRTGWMFLRDPESDDDDDEVIPYAEDEDAHWYYFLNSGKKYVPNLNNADYKLYKIGGVYYCFDGNGAMQTGWVNMGDHEDGNFENYRYFQENGHVQTGWYSTTPPEDDMDMDLGEDVEWYYFSNNGTPKVGNPIEEATTGDLEKINGITYLFNEKGNPVYGLRRLQVGSEDEYACYFFGADKATSSVVKGRGTVEEGDGTRSYFYFSETGSKAGRGYTGVKDNYLYYMGKLQEAESGTKYEAIEMENGIYLVNTSGKVVKSGTVKDAGGTKYKTNSSGKIIQVDGVNDDGSDLARDPVEPDYWDE